MFSSATWTLATLLLSRAPPTGRRATMYRTRRRFPPMDRPSPSLPHPPTSSAATRTERLTSLCKTALPAKSRASLSPPTAQGNERSSGPALSADGRYIVFVSSATDLVAEDTNREDDVFVHDRLTGETTRVSVTSNGEQANRGSGWGSLSGDGRFVAFHSAAANLVA